MAQRRRKKRRNKKKTEKKVEKRDTDEGTKPDPKEDDEDSAKEGEGEGDEEGTTDLLDSDSSFGAEGDAIDPVEDEADLTTQVEAQEEPEAEPEEDEPKEEEYDVGFDGGFFIRERTGKFRINFGLESRVQGSIFQNRTPDPERVDPPSEAAIRPRSMQLLVRGNAFEKFGFTLAFGLGLDPDRPLDSSQMTLAFASATLKPWLNFRTGLFVVPFGLEGSTYFFSSKTIENSITTEALAPRRDSGVNLYGSVADGALFYSAAVIGGSGVARIEPRDEPDAVGRLQIAPIGEYLKLGVSGQYGKQPFNLIGGRVFSNTRAQRDILFDSPTSGLRRRVAADLIVHVGPATLKAEGIFERAKRDNILNEAGQVIEDGPVSASQIERLGGYTELGVFVYGSNASGIETIGKYERLTAQTKGPPNEIQPIELDVYTAGINWYLQKSVLLQLNGIRMDLKRFSTPEFPGNTPVTYLDNKKRYLGLMQFQFWFF